MIVFVDLVSGKDICSDSYPSKKLIDGAIVALDSKKIDVGGEGESVDIGANASKEEEEEKLDSDKKQVINIVHAHDLQKIELSKKDFKTFQKQYWQKLKSAIDKMRYEALGLGEDYKAPADKTEAKNAEKAAIAKLDKSGKVSLNEANKRLESYKANFEKLQNFVKDEIEKNFEEFEFFLPNEANLGASVIIPARYVGEALSPTFYVFVDGVNEVKY